MKSCYNHAIISVESRFRSEKMKKDCTRRLFSNLVLFTLILGAALGISMLLAKLNNDNNPFAMGVFILAVAVVARFTNGYLW